MDPAAPDKSFEEVQLYSAFFISGLIYYVQKIINLEPVHVLYFIFNHIKLQHSENIFMIFFFYFESKTFKFYSKSQCFGFEYLLSVVVLRDDALD